MADPDQDDGNGTDTDQDGSYCEDGVRRPMNAFFIFCKRHRDVVRERYPNLENRSITKILGEWWASLDFDEKSTYTSLAKQYKDAFMKAHPDFKWYKLPSAPARTLMTRPSNNRLQMGKKEKNGAKSALCEITLGKLADEEHLGGLSSLLMSDSSDNLSPSSDYHRPTVSPCPVTSSSICNISKPPKKRYLVNGEFMCKQESKSYDVRDDQTQNACSALLELAEICVSTASHPFPDSKCSTISDGGNLFNNITGYSSTYNPSLALKNLCNNAISSEEHGSILPSASSLPYVKPITSSHSSMYLNHGSIDHAIDVADLQEQPLNLCKQKGKMFTASNQQLIDHFVDKFLCPTDAPDLLPSKPSTHCKSEDNCQSFTLSAAIESAIDQAYSRDPPKVEESAAKCAETRIPETVVKMPTNVAVQDDDSDSGTEVVFIDKIKKACLASSRKSQEKLSTNCSSSYSSNEKVDWSKPDSSAAIKSEEKEILKQGTPTKPGVQNDYSCDNSFDCDAIPKKVERNFSSSKCYSRFVSPQKKSQVWCNLFMREQLENSDSEESADAKKAVGFDMASPVRRNSQRTCKGRRYQALITEGLLQSTKERKPGAGRKPFTNVDKGKIKSSSTSDCPPIILKSKKRRREVFGKSKSLDKVDDDDSDVEKSVFDLNEKIASLPKCSLETLNKKRKSSPSSITGGTKFGDREAKKAAKEPCVPVPGETDASEKDNQLDLASSGRFKSGSFDLEQHIASLPKCDIEVLNKRKSRRELQ